MFKNFNRRHLALFTLVCLLFAMTTQSSYAFKIKSIGKKKVKSGLEQVLKGVGISILVREIGPELNKFINTLMLNNKVENKEATKVVPIFTFGEGGEAGACQVTGPVEAVEQVRAVYAISGKFTGKGRLNLQALIPTSSIDPTRLSRVYGVGISAIIDYKL